MQEAVYKNLKESQDRKKMYRASQKASFAIEYGALIVIIVLALLAMQFYLKRSMFGRLRTTGDTFGQGRQYEPGVTVVTGN